MAESYDYDVAVIGGGPGGYVAAIRAAQLGASTCVIEKADLGGVCTNVGCIPTKALIHAATVKREIEHAAAIGVKATGVEIDYSALGAHRDGVIEKLRGGIASLLKANGVESIQGEAAFEDAHTLAVTAEGGAVRVTARVVVIATGSASIELSCAPFDGERVIDSSDAVRADALPESIIVVGGGYIGCEFAGLYSSFGVKLTVVELMDRLLPEMDEDCSREVTKLLKKAKSKILTGVKLEGVKTTARDVTAVLSDGAEVTAERILVSVGRRPVTDGLGLDAVGVETGERGEIVVNEHMQTSVANVYAVGDVTGGIMLAHVASQEAVVAAAHATGTITAVMDYRVVPACAFTFPQVATVGMTEAEAAEAVEETKVTRFPMRALGKAHATGMTDGFVKIVADAKSGEVLGVHIAAADASSLIGEAALGMHLQVTAEEIAQTIHAHPTMPESLREAAEGIVGLPINWTG